MTKLDFLEALNKKLKGLPEKEVEDRLSFYIEMIDDRIEEGIPEEEAVAQIGSVNKIAEQIISDIPLKEIAKKRIKPQKRFKAWEIVLIALGSPVWIPLLIAAVIVILALYIVLWSLIASAWAVFASIAACAPAGVVAGIMLAFTSSALPGIALVGAGLVCAGLAIFAFWGCKEATVGTAKLTKRIFVGIKKALVKKEKA